MQSALHSERQSPIGNRQSIGTRQSTLNRQSSIDPAIRNLRSTIRRSAVAHRPSAIKRERIDRG
jgi:hypothetical protein